MADIEAPTKVDLYRSLSTMSNDRLRQIRSDLEKAIASGEHYDSVTESGRSSSQSLLAQPHDSLHVVFSILAKRGQLTQDEVEAWNEAQPKTRIRVTFRPKYYYGA